MQSFNVLDRDLDILGHHFLEASAGTGKTFAIEHLFLRLILEPKTAFSLDQILVVTFTKAATRELKKRIRLNLEKAFAALQKREGDGYLSAFFNEGNREALHRIEAALISFDEAQIFTIHGFCHRMLSEYGFMVDEPDERAYKDLMREHVKDFFRTHLGSSQSQVELILKKHRHDAKQLQKVLLSLVENGGEMPLVADYHESFEHFQEGLRHLHSVVGEKLIEDFQALSPFYKGVNSSVEGIRELASLLEKKECTLEEFEGLLLKEVPFLEGWGPDNLKIRPKMPASLPLHYPGFFQKMTQRLSPPLKKARDPLKILLGMATECKKNWKQHLLVRDKLAPDEILACMQKRLECFSFFDAVSSKYRAVIIDEFQDTDPLQWEIFRRLFLTKANPVKACYLVGDPKQAIYGFRNADIYTYMEALQFVGEDKRASLDTNFRSAPELLDALNAFFSLSPWMELPLWKRTIPYLPVKPGLSPTQEQGGLHFFIVEAKSGRERNWPTSFHEEHYFFPFITCEIQKISPSHRIAILVKDRFQAERLHSYLTDFNIHSSVKRGESIQDNGYLNELESLLETVDDPQDSVKLRRALATRLLGWSSEEILSREKSYPEPFSTMSMEAMKNLFHELRLLLEEEGMAQFFQKLFQLAHPPLELRKLTEFLLEKRPPDLLFFLKELKNKEEEEFFYSSSGANEEEAIVIMTTHMSKGLEFDSVFALGIAFRHGKQEEMIRLREKVLPFDAEDPLCQQGLEEMEAEKLRQLYVALTRAKKRVYVALPIELEKKEGVRSSPLQLFLEKTLGPHPEKSALFALLERLAQTTHVTYSLIDPEHVPKKLERCQEESVSAPLIVPPFPEERFSSFTGLSKKTLSLSSPILSEEELPLGKETGILIHHLLEKIFTYGWHSPFQEEKIVAMVQQKLTRSPFERYKDQLFQQIKTALHQRLPTTDFCLADIPPSQVMEEMEFLFPERELLIKGFVDLVFHQAGKYYLLDWKSNALESYDQESLKALMVSHDYLLQASLYATALKRYVKLFDTPLEFGGAFYYFLRGNAFYHFFPEE